MKKVLFIFLSLSLLTTSVAQAYVASSSSYILQSDSINFVGGGSDSASYHLEGTAGEQGTGYSSTTGQTLHAGFQQNDTSDLAVSCSATAGGNAPATVTWTAAPTGGTGPYSYAWSGQTSGTTQVVDQYGVGAGTYTGSVTVTDAHAFMATSAACSVTVNPAITHGGDVPGCMDPAASNYNPLATVDNGSCTTQVPNVFNFQAVYQVPSNRVALTWQVSYNNFAAVRIVRTTNGIATSPSSGTLIYDGTANATYDTNITPGVTYYYTAFVRSTNGAYSSGVLAVVTIPSNPENPSEPPIIPGVPIFPPNPSTNPQLVTLTTGDFYFVQPGDTAKPLTPGGTIRLDGAKNTTVYIDYDRLPEVLKTIVVTLIDPVDPKRTFTFLLRVNDNKSRYTATIGPLVRTGNYGVIIQVLNYSDQSLKRLDGTLLVSGVWAIRVAESPKFLIPTAVSTGLAVGVLQTVLITSNAASLYELYLLLLRGFMALLAFLGLRRKEKPWGTVYDAVTKRPIDPAVVSVRKNGQEVTSAITDLDGRYGFLLPAGEYEIVAGKTHYRFPSQVLKGRESDELYSDLYYGEPIEATGNDVVTRNIPLDPIGFDWNEFVKNKVAYFKLYSRKEVIRARITNTIYWVGLLFTIFTVVVTPSIWNIVILALYGVIYMVQEYYRRSHRVVTVKKSGEAVPFAIVSFFYPGVNTRVKSVVTDALGRFYALVAPGEYYVTVEEKQSDSSYLKVYQSDPMTLKKGVLSSDLTF